MLVEWNIFKLNAFGFFVEKDVFGPGKEEWFVGVVTNKKAVLEQVQLECVFLSCENKIH